MKTSEVDNTIPFPLILFFILLLCAFLLGFTYDKGYKRGHIDGTQSVFRMIEIKRIALPVFDSSCNYRRFLDIFFYK